MYLSTRPFLSGPLEEPLPAPFGVPLRLRQLLLPRLLVVSLPRLFVFFCTGVPAPPAAVGPLAWAVRPAVPAVPQIGPVVGEVGRADLAAAPIRPAVVAAAVVAAFAPRAPLHVPRAVVPVPAAVPAIVHVPVPVPAIVHVPVPVMQPNNRVPLNIAAWVAPALPAIAPPVPLLPMAVIAAVPPAAARDIPPPVVRHMVAPVGAPAANRVTAPVELSLHGAIQPSPRIVPVPAPACARHHAHAAASRAAAIMIPAVALPSPRPVTPVPSSISLPGTSNSASCTGWI